MVGNQESTGTKLVKKETDSLQGRQKNGKTNESLQTIKKIRIKKASPSHGRGGCSREKGKKRPGKKGHHIKTVEMSKGA